MMHEHLKVCSQRPFCAFASISYKRLMKWDAPPFLELLELFQFPEMLVGSILDREWTLILSIISRKIYVIFYDDKLAIYTCSNVSIKRSFSPNWFLNADISGAAFGFCLGSNVFITDLAFSIYFLYLSSIPCISISFLANVSCNDAVYKELMTFIIE